MLEMDIGNKRYEIKIIYDAQARTGEAYLSVDTTINGEEAQIEIPTILGIMFQALLRVDSGEV